MKFRIVTQHARVGQTSDHVSEKDFEKSMASRGYKSNGTAYSQGQLLPTFAELAGPMRDGDAIRYEDWDTYNLLSM